MTPVARVHVWDQRNHDKCSCLVAQWWECCSSCCAMAKFGVLIGSTVVSFLSFFSVIFFLIFSHFFFFFPSRQYHRPCSHSRSGFRRGYQVDSGAGQKRAAGAESW